MRLSIPTLVMLVGIAVPATAAATDWSGAPDHGGDARDPIDTPALSQPALIVAEASMQRNGIDEAVPESPQAHRSKPDHTVTTRSTLGWLVFGFTVLLILVV